jgi:hypothetical protein
MHVSSAEELMIPRVAVGRSIQPQDIPSHSLCSWCNALFYALLLTYAFDSGGALQAQCFLKHIRVRKIDLAGTPSDIRVFRARNDAMILKAAINLLLGPHLCFASSFAICGGLRRLGFSCHIVVGYEQVHQYTETPMDAYVEYEHEPVSTTLDATYGFAPMLTYGLEPEGS